MRDEFREGGTGLVEGEVARLAGVGDFAAGLEFAARAEGGLGAVIQIEDMWVAQVVELRWWSCSRYRLDGGSAHGGSRWM